MAQFKYLEYSNLYDSILSKSKIYRCGDKHFLDLIKKECKNKTLIFEPGCGNGIITEKLAKIKNTKIIAADPSKPLIDGAKKRLKKYKNVKLIKKLC